MILDEKMLSGVAYLEMARKAGELGFKKKIIRIKNIFWLTPLMINNKLEKIETLIFYSEEELCFQIFLIQEIEEKELVQETLEIFEYNNSEKKN